MRGQGLKTFFNFYGGKWRAAKLYPDPRHEVLIEPFAGGAGYATRHYERQVVLVDADPVITSVWRWLTTVSPEEVMSLPLDFDSVDHIQASQAAKWFLGFRVNTATTHPCKRFSAWARTQKGRTTFWSSRVRDRIASQVEKIRHWRIVDGDYTVAPSVEATWFVDPPYNNKAGSRYRCQPGDFRQLASWCRSRQGQVIVCEQEGATWLPFKPIGRIRSTPGKHGKSWSSEAVWITHSEDRVF